MADSPPLLSDAWAVWVVDRLTADGHTALTDEDIAAIISQPNSDTRNVLNTLLAESKTAAAEIARLYTDAANEALATSLNRALSNGTIQAVSMSKQYTDIQTAATLKSAKEYTDANAGTGGVAKSYVDDGDTATLNSATSYTDTAKTQANNYTDGKLADTLTAAKKYTDDELADYLSTATYAADRVSVLSTADGAAADRDAEILRLAKEYADAGSGGASTDYVDNAINDAKSELTSNTDSRIDAVISQVNGYTDDAIEASATGISTLIDGKIGGVTTYADDNDVIVLREAKEYTDTSIANSGGSGGGGVTPAYVDSGDANTLAAAKTYADTGTTQVYQNSRTYADTKYALPAGGIPKSTLASTVQASLDRSDAAVPKGQTWVDLTQYLAAGFAVVDQLGMIREGNRRELRGAFKINTGNLAVLDAVLSGLPQSDAPKQYARITCAGNGAAMVNVRHVADGTTHKFDVVGITGTTQYAYLSGYSWYVV
ncbi:tail needle protein [Curtobacterium phage Ayka]|nr:tail needle protein [Curtobacterium phage Ayka]